MRFSDSSLRMSSFRTCSFEKEVLEALQAGHWPDGCVPELRVHVENCSSCGDLVLVTRSFQSARSEAVVQAPGDSPSLIWWRAQLRRRYAATERVSRPITIAQTFAMLVTLLVAAVFVAWQYGHGLRWASWFTGFSSARVMHMLSTSLAKPEWNLLVVIPGLAIVALLSGVVLYLVSEKS